MTFTGTSAVITGGASGIGAATARRLSELGAFIVIADLQEEKGTELAEELGGAFIRVDVTSTEQLIAAVELATAHSPLKSAVNSAGIGWAQRIIGRDGTLESAHSLDRFRKVVEINLVGSFDLMRIAATAMSRNEPDADGCRGAIVNLASIAAFDGQTGQGAYSASKGAIAAMTLPIARDLAASGIRVNTVAPGLVDTPIYGSGPKSDAFKDNLGQHVLFPHRLGQPEEIASMIVECLANPYTNGTVVRVDGGIRMPPK